MLFILIIIGLKINIINIMNKNRHSSMHKILGPPNLVLYDGEESKL